MRKVAVIFVLSIIGLALLAMLLTPHFYLLKRVNSDEVGIQIRGGQIVNVVPLAFILISASMLTS